MGGPAVEMRWVIKSGMPKQGWLPYNAGQVGRQLWQVLQWRVCMNISEDGLHPPICDEWEDVPLVVLST